MLELAPTCTYQRRAIVLGDCNHIQSSNHWLHPRKGVQPLRSECSAQYSCVHHDMPHLGIAAARQIYAALLRS
jgi:hypothetical protein